MAQSISDGFKSLPRELFGIIVGHLNKTDFKSLRQVSKTFADAFEPSLFGPELTIRLDKLASHCRHRPTSVLRNIETLFVQTIEYEDIDEKTYKVRQNFDRYHWANFHICPFVTQCDRCNGHYRYQSYQTYKRLRDHHLATLVDHACLDYLRLMMHSMTNLKRLTLTDGNYHAISNPHAACTILECTNQFSHHALSAVAPFSGLHGLGSKHFRLLMRILWESERTVQELAVTSKHEDVGLDYIALIMTPPRLQHTAYVLSSLKKFHVDLYADEFMSVYKDPQKGSIAQTLSYAKNLESLTVRIVAIWRTAGFIDLELVLGGCTFPKLQSCSLESFKSTTSSLLKSTGGSRSLTQLSLAKFELTSGTWERVAGKLKKGIQLLRDVQLQELYESGSLPSEDPKQGNGLQQFFNGSGNNPFRDVDSIYRKPVLQKPEARYPGGRYTQMKKDSGMSYTIGIKG
ncbi:MAG: hypothetical protein Q9213_000984 [Squamulea squamosa]